VFKSLQKDFETTFFPRVKKSYCEQRFYSRKKVIDNDTGLLINSINRNQDLKLIKKKSEHTGDNLKKWCKV